ncbi:hypothetical protein RIF29_01957 [Crotalaria pallida]|uniref:Uncharacterized protein n=1 Tax=Crotalaria pallida TaxID=3830 RepID=A0AAN9P8C7_CROPI
MNRERSRPIAATNEATIIARAAVNEVEACEHHLLPHLRRLRRHGVEALGVVLCWLRTGPLESHSLRLLRASPTSSTVSNRTSPDGVFNRCCAPPLLVLLLQLELNRFSCLHCFKNQISRLKSSTVSFNNARRHCFGLLLFRKSGELYLLSCSCKEDATFTGVNLQSV